MHQSPALTGDCLGKSRRGKNAELCFTYSLIQKEMRFRVLLWPHALWGRGASQGTKGAGVGA